jgi:hypothetical protein
VGIQSASEQTRESRRRVRHDMFCNNFNSESLLVHAIAWHPRRTVASPRVPGAYLTWANSMFLAFFALN